MIKDTEYTQLKVSTWSVCQKHRIYLFCCDKLDLDVDILNQLMLHTPQVNEITLKLKRGVGFERLGLFLLCALEQIVTGNCNRSVDLTTVCSLLFITDAHIT
jgi:hypothetical protein